MFRISTADLQEITARHSLLPHIYADRPEIADKLGECVYSLCISEVAQFSW